MLLKSLLESSVNIRVKALEMQQHLLEFRDDISLKLITASDDMAVIHIEPPKGYAKVELKALDQGQCFISLYESLQSSVPTYKGLRDLDTKRLAALIAGICSRCCK